MADPFAHFLLMLVLMVAAARVCGGLARLVGQPAVLGELFAGVLLGPSVAGHLLGWDPLNPHDPTMHFLAELGVIILLFEIGLETDWGQLLTVGGTSIVVAVVGVVVPFLLGYAVCALLQYPTVVATVAGATLTATSVGITARVLNDLGRLQDVESRIILGAAVLDDIIGLIILALITTRLTGEELSFGGLVRIAAIAFGFLLVTLVLGWMATPILERVLKRLAGSDWLAMFALLFVLTLAFVADVLQPGLAIVGAFTAGLVLAKLPQVRTIERSMAPLGHLFVPIFFVMTGAAVDILLLNPLNAENYPVLKVGGLLLIAAVAGKYVAGYAPFWFRGRKSVIGIGMVPRGEVGLIFADAGHKVLGEGLYSALTLLVMLTTFLVPPLLKQLLSRREVPNAAPSGVAELTTEP
jgi:Na+:H+ antiporter